MTIDNKKDLKLNAQTISSSEDRPTKEFDRSNISSNNSNKDSIEPQQTPEKKNNCTPTKLMINKLLSPKTCKENLFSAKSAKTYISATNVATLRNKLPFNSYEHHIVHTPSEPKPSNNEHVNTIMCTGEFEVIDSSVLSLFESSFHSIDEGDYETLCEAALIIGLPEDNSNLIPQSEKYPPNCQHKECSILSSFQPHILHHYLNPKHKSNPIDISHLTANMVFPLGISICFRGDNKPIWPQPYKPFLNVIRNEKGETYYLVCFHYFKHIPVSIFDSTYKVNPLKEYTKFINMSPEKLEENLSIISSFIDSESFLIPECITLVSRFPFINQMLVCLESLYHMNQTDINPVINHLINELPVPINNRLIMFYLPNNTNIIPLYPPTEPNESNFFSNEVDILELFTIDNIILVFHLILLEQKLLFINNNYHVLSFALVEFIQLIYPLVWVDTIVPVLSLTTVEFLQSIIPFVMGIDEFLLQFSINNDYIDFTNGSIVFVNLSTNTIGLHVENKKTNKKLLLDKLNIPDLPAKVYKFLCARLKELKRDKELFSAIKVKEKIREVFCTAMIMMMGDYKRYLYYIEGDTNVFNNECFLQHRKKEERNFYKEFISTQLFSQFISNEKEANKYGKSNVSNIKYDNAMYSLNTYNYLSKDFLMLHHGVKNSAIKIKKSTTNPSLKKEDANTNTNNSIPNNELSRHTEGLKQMTKIRLSNDKGDSLNDSCKFTSNSKEKKSYGKGTNNSNENITSDNTIENKLLIHDNNKVRSTKTDNLLITPFFMKVPITHIKKPQIHSFIQNHIMKIYPNSTSNKTLSKAKYISNYLHKIYNVENICESHRKYYINKDNQNEPLNPFHCKGLRRRSLSSDCLRTQQFSDTKDINEWFTNICTSCEDKLKQQSNSSTKNICEYMNNYSYREHLANLLIQENDALEYDKDARNAHIKMLTHTCLSELGKVIQRALEEIKGKYLNIKYAKRFILALFRYCALSKKDNQNVFLYELIDINKVYVLTNNVFWKEWFEEEYLKYKLDNDNKLKVVFGLLHGLSEFMFKLQIDQMFIKNLIIDRLGKEYVGEEMEKEFEDVFNDTKEDIQNEIIKKKKKGK